MKKNKGFTMVEILATIVILGLLSAVGVMTISNIISKSHKEYFKSQENMVLLAGKEYYSDYRSKLPKTIGQVSQVALSTLINEKYIKEVVDYRKNACNYTGSSVKVQKQGENEYSYSVFLKCDGYNGYENGSNPSIIYLPNSKKSNKDILVEMQISDDEEVKAYSYIVYKDDNVIKTVNRTNYNKKIQIALTGDGSYKIVGTAWDNEENVTIKESGTYVIDATPPNCAQVKINSNLPSNKWTYKDIQFTFSNFPSDMESYDWLTNKDDSTCSPKKAATQLNTFYLQSNNKRNVTTKTLSGEGKRRGQLILYDEIGNSCKITTEEFWIDKTKPTVKLEGSTPSGKVTNKNVELTATPTPSCTRSSYTYVFEKQVGATWQVVARQTTPKYTVQEEGKVTYRVTVETEAGQKGTSNTYVVNIDKTPPNCNTVRFSPNETNGWSKSTVSVIVSPNNSDIASYDVLRNLNQGGYATYSYSRTGNYTAQLSEEGTHTLQVKAYDEAGNYCTANSGNYKIDKTPPTCVSSGGSSEWKKSITLTGTCSDSGSGCQGNVTKTISTDKNSTTESPGTVYDNAGNSTVCPGNQTVKIDKTGPTKPVVTLKVNSDSGASYTSNTWTGQNVFHKVTSSDAGSGIAKYQYSHDGVNFSDELNKWTYHENSSRTQIDYLINWGGSWTFYIRAVDNLGNVSPNSDPFTLKIDKTAPTCVSSGGNSNWASSVTLTGTCSDSGSGCQGNVTKTISTDKNSTTESPGTVYDNVGNSAVCPGNQTVKIDKTAPTCVSSGGNSNWASSVTLTGTCSDSGSGCQGNATRTISTDLISTTESPGTVYDYAGNSATCPGNQTVKIDKTAPTQPAITNPSGGNWSQGNFSLTVSSSDTGSGLADWYYSYNQETWTKYASSYGVSPFTTSPFTAQRDQLAYIRVCDNAGNCSVNSTQIRIDTKAPTKPVGSGNEDCVTKPKTKKFTYTTSDNLSGINHWEYKLGKDGDVHKWSGSATDSLSKIFKKVREKNIFVRAVDNAGNESAWSDKKKICIKKASEADTDTPDVPLNVCTIRGNTLRSSNGYPWDCSGPVYHTGLTTYYQIYCSDGDGDLTPKGIGGWACPVAPYGPNEGWTVIDDSNF